MIFDRIENIEVYAGLGKNFETAVQFIQKLALNGIEDQEFSVDDDRVYAFARHFSLKESSEVLYESHRRYADIQLLLDGEETMYAAVTKGMKSKIPYEEEKDIEFYEDSEKHTCLKFVPGDFAVFFPWDAHKPCCRAGRYENSFKLVIKVLLS